MTEPAGKPTRLKRPAIVVLCTLFFGVLAFQAVGVVLVLARSLKGNPDLFILAPAALAVIAFVCLLFAARSQITYYITSVTIAVLSLKALYVAVTLNRIVGYLLTMAFCFLFWRFAFGRPSRVFYGLSIPPEK